MVTDYEPADWDRIVRHGLLSDGRPAAMPSEDFQMMSDQELSDIIALSNPSLQSTTRFRHRPSDRLGRCSWLPVRCPCPRI